MKADSYTSPQVIGPEASRDAVLRFLSEHPEFAAPYRSNRHFALTLARSAYVEMSTRCNLRCEGCYYFNGEYDQVKENDELADWDAFFADQAEKGTRFIYLVGAEPSLEPERLAIASKYIKRGLIGTNGIRKIDPAIPYMLHISVWGAPKTDARLRGADAFSKALRNYQGQTGRVLFVYTLTPKNITEAHEVLERVQGAGLNMTFNMYSPTHTYLDRLSAANDPQSKFFRLSSKSDNLCWDNASLRLARSTVSRLMEEFPDTLVYSKAYNDWVTQPGPRFELDENDVAPHCLSRVGGSLSLFGPDLEPVPGGKCCTSDVDCSTCRLYSGGLSSRLKLREADLRSGEAFQSWLDICDHLFKIYIYTPSWQQERPSAQLLSA